MAITEKDKRDVIREVRKYVKDIKILIDDDLFDILDPGTQACFCHQDDIIYLKDTICYRSKAYLRHILFHELGHWATKQGRAGRVNKFNKNHIKKSKRNQNIHHNLNFALEEMIVEAVSYYFCKASGFKVNANSHEKYIKNYAKQSGLDKFWTTDLERYYDNKVKSLISFIKNYNKISINP